MAEERSNVEEGRNTGSGRGLGYGRRRGDPLVNAFDTLPWIIPIQSGKVRVRLLTLLSESKVRNKLAAKEASCSLSSFGAKAIEYRNNGHLRRSPPPRDRQVTIASV
jgi:hypothetical protein